MSCCWTGICSLGQSALELDVFTLHTCLGLFKPTISRAAGREIQVKLLRVITACSALPRWRCGPWRFAGPRLSQSCSSSCSAASFRLHDFAPRGSRATSKQSSIAATLLPQSLAQRQRLTAVHSSAVSTLPETRHRQLAIPGVSVRYKWTGSPAFRRCSAVQLGCKTWLGRAQKSAQNEMTRTRPIKPSRFVVRQGPGSLDLEGTGGTARENPFLSFVACHGSVVKSNCWARSLKPRRCPTAHEHRAPSDIGKQK